jgi:hypothetical protein
MSVLVNGLLLAKKTEEEEEEIFNASSNEDCFFTIWNKA